jgi:uncharacterized repeat protein (TIGR03843 family)
VPPADTLSLLLEGPLQPIGRLVDASNAALLVRVGDASSAVPAVYKPVTGERPLWDFPEGSLAHREVAAYLVSEAGGWGAVPTTVLRDGPFGLGSVQEWVGPVDGSPTPVVDAFPPGEVPAGWLVVLHGEGARGQPVHVAHADTEALRSMAVLDLVLNNADRKGSHLLAVDDRLYGIDNGLSLHREVKLRTVLWGWAGQPISPEDQHRLASLAEVLAERASGPRQRLAELLSSGELDALEARCRALLDDPAYPLPSGGWRAIPWPPL